MHGGRPSEQEEISCHFVNFLPTVCALWLETPDRFLTGFIWSNQKGERHLPSHSIFKILIYKLLSNNLLLV